MTYSTKALMIEDSQIAQTASRQLFTQLDCPLEIVALASRALEKITVTAYDIIFIDIRLPDINGLEMVRVIRLSEPKGTHIPIIVVTSTPTPELRALAQDRGCDDFIAKPITLATLRTIFNKHLNPEQLTRMGMH